MPGTKGRSGGPREGAGRPVSTVTFRQDQHWYCQELWTEDGKPTGPGTLATVEIDGRNIVRLVMLDGTTLRLVK